ncbi:MAG: phenylalanine--tRNA ligase subunit beta, partial [Chloroflexota bacterium]|nr:phenylalanine--tRNA ligase subunit beta [Chloroflexota bacterium]
SIIGVAREAAAITGAPFRDPFPRWAAEPLDVPKMPGIVTVEDTTLCPRYTALVMEGVTVGPSPEWMQRRLHAVGLRPVNNIVDVSNYVMIEYGQPNHIFDRDRLVGRRLIVRHARPGETLELINHETKALTPAMAAVCDEAGVTDLGGIIGGTRSEIVETTTNILIEVATWEMRTIRHTRQALNIRTDASARYERGLEPELTMPSARRVIELIRQLCPAARLVGYTDIYPNPPEPRSLTMPFSKIAAVLGVAYPLDAVREVLTRLQFGVAISHDADPMLTIAIPPHRADVSRPEDIVEEVARIIGYETIPTTMIVGTTPHVIRSDRWIAREAARDAVASAGLVEVSTYSFTSTEALDRLAAANGPGAADVPIVRLVNPLGEWEGMRPTLRASLLATASDNLKFISGVAIGEVANVYLPREPGALPDERLTLGVVLAGMDAERSLGVVPRAFDFYDLKGMIEAIMSALGVGPLVVVPTNDLVFQPGRVAHVSAGGQPIGVMGEVHPRVAEAFDLAGRTMLAELDLEPIVASVAAHRGVLRQLPVTSRYPATENDFAVVVDDAVAAGDVAQVLAHAVGSLGQRVQLFDVYRGDQVPTGKKSLTFAVTMQAPDRALSEAEVAKVRDRVSQAIAKRLRATLRS